MTESSLPPDAQSQAVPPDVYDREYFLSSICEGFEEFEKDGSVSFNKSKQVKVLDPKPGMKILDAGCGRGETLLACARLGAEPYGIDYSAAAADLTREVLAKYGFENADVRTGSVTALPWPDDFFDRVQFSDVIEHLDPPQTVPAFAEFRRVLKPGGFLHVHTAPNLYFMKYGWPASRPFVKLIGHSEIADKVDEWFKIAEDYHVNEQSVHSMRKALKGAGFEDPHVWLDPDVLRGGKFHLLEGFDSLPVRIAKNVAAWRPVRLFMSNDVLAVAHK
jgi:ubiquinone/menaquinone biosynthesis C-methylase UbiE